MFYEFQNIFSKQICFSHHQIKLVFPDFDNKNLGRWQKKNYILKLRNGLYTFTEFINKPNMVIYAANCICKPSYVSVHFVLSYYGIIPEVITTITSVSTLKTKQFRNGLGVFTYQSLQPEFYFGYEIKETVDFQFRMACPEKALIDFFHLFPVYNTPEDMELLRFDTFSLKENVDVSKLDEYLHRIQSPVLYKRINLMKKIYEL